eukprot:11928311-Alexandrium_andersonii.AAC.1
MWTAGSAGTQQSPCRRRCGEWPSRAATENGTRTGGGQPSSESIGQVRPNPWWWGPPYAGSTA